MFVVFAMGLAFFLQGVLCFSHIFFLQVVLCFLQRVRFFCNGL